jgi:hypothetical protein
VGIEGIDTIYTTALSIGRKRTIDTLVLAGWNFGTEVLLKLELAARKARM